MKNIISILLCISLLFCTGCTKKSILASNEPESYPVVVKSDDGIFQIQITEGWRFTAKGELNDDANLEIKTQNGAMFLITLMEDKDDFYVDLEGFRDVVASDIEKKYKVSLEESIPIKLGKYNAYQSEFNLKHDSEKSHLWHFSIETENYYGQVLMRTSENMATEKKDELFAIANSLRENVKYNSLKTP